MFYSKSVYILFLVKMLLPLPKLRFSNARMQTVFQICGFQIKIKSNLLLYSLYYAKACNELAGPISASLRPGNAALFEEMLQRWRAVGNTVSDLTGPRFEPQTSRSRDECVTARPTGRFQLSIGGFQLSILCL